MLELRTINDESKVVESVSYTQERVVERTDYLAEIAKVDEALAHHAARTARLQAKKAELEALLQAHKDKFDTVEAERVAKEEAAKEAERVALVEAPIEVSEEVIRVR